MQEINQYMKKGIKIYKANILSILVYEKRGNVSRLGKMRSLEITQSGRCHD